MPTCSNCGAFGEGEYCPKCGVPFGAPPPPSPPSGMRPSMEEPEPLGGMSPPSEPTEPDPPVYGSQPQAYQPEGQPYGQPPPYGTDPYGQPYGQPPPGQYPPGAYPPGYYGQPQPATGALVLGILSIVAAFLSPLIGIILGIVAIYLGSQGKREGRPNAQTAYILGILGIVVSLVMVVVAVLLLASFGFF